MNKELSASNLSGSAKDAVAWIFKFGAVLNKAIPLTTKAIDMECLQQKGLEKHLSQAIDWLSTARTLASSSHLPGPLKDLMGITFDERLRTDLYGLAAELYLGDLEAMFSGYRWKDRFKWTKSDLKGRYDKLLVVIDDFEIIGRTVSEFVVSSLIQGFRTRPT